MLVSSLTTQKLIDISFSDNHSLALGSNNQAYSWGFTLDGALGYQCDSECQITPKAVPLQ
jgi:hypothetical protein